VLALCQWPLWKVDVQIKTRHNSLEYKYVRVREDGTIGQWEPVENRCTPTALRRACTERDSEQASERETLQVGRPACFATQGSTSGTGLRRNECVRVCVHACARACIHVFMCSCVCVFVARVLNLKGFEKATQLRIQDGEFARKDSESASGITVLESESRAVHFFA
jgi:hypothetical protein